MGNPIRIKTSIGGSKKINVNLEQNFDQLEILSLTLRQQDVYTKDCANYGVIVGRVTANNGLGIPNARISIFIPLTLLDQFNPIISTLYPYNSPDDKNEDGYRYNLLPYEKSYSKHAATGTFPSKEDILKDNSVLEIYEKYYKYTVKTNESGDYMIMGAPLGSQLLIMDVDLSDIGEFSLTPQDLIRMGKATEAQVAGAQFRTSNDLNSLPQIVNLSKTLDVSPLWGDQTTCQISINRVDFDLRDDANIDIQPTAVFMGSMFSSADKYRIRKKCKPKDNLGNLCQLTTSPGQIIAIRQTIGQNTNGAPIIEEHQLEQSGNVIDEDGTWMLELPMNLDYFTTNEFGEKILSYDPQIGVPTKAKYRFKIKWQQSNNVNELTKRAYYLVPNVREFGWETSSEPNYDSAGSLPKERQLSSYYFGLDWSGYTNGYTGTSARQRIEQIVNCEDTFYEFRYNKVYTVANLIDQYKNGRGRGKFIGIKEIDNDECSSSINKFPANEGFKNFDLQYFIFTLIITIFQYFGFILIVNAHIVLALWSLVKLVLCAICQIPLIRRIGACKSLKCDQWTYTVGLPMITYPDCTMCDCEVGAKKSSLNNYEYVSPTGALTAFSFPGNYETKLIDFFSADTLNVDAIALATGQALGGLNANRSDSKIYKNPFSAEFEYFYEENKSRVTIMNSFSLPLGERINLFNGRYNYFLNNNKLKVTFAKQSNIGKYHYDNSLTVITAEKYEVGSLLTFVNPNSSTDRNYLYTADTGNEYIRGISGTTFNDEKPTTISLKYATSETTDQTIQYNLPYGYINENQTTVRYLYPKDIEYFQVVTALTISEASKLWNISDKQSLGGIITEVSKINFFKPKQHFISDLTYYTLESLNLSAYDYFEDIENQYILILQRGVDPYSPFYVNEYNVGNLFGFNDSDSKFTFTAETRLNIPIQKLNSNDYSVQNFSYENNIFYESYFFEPSNDYSGFTTQNIGYYGGAQSTYYPTIIPESYSPLNTNSGIFAILGNNFYDTNQSAVKYDSSEDFSSMGMFYGIYKTPPIFVVLNNIPPSLTISYQYYTSSLLPEFTTTPLQLNERKKIIMRSDRLPTSDQLDGGAWNTNPSVLQQNVNFAIYDVSTGTESVTDTVSQGFDSIGQDIDDLPESLKVIASFSCEGMVSLECYQGFGSNFSINQNCDKLKIVKKGCYQILKRPLLDLLLDLDTFPEWVFRLKFFYGLCRGILSQTFTNNWVNGALYAFPFQNIIYFDKQNKPKEPIFCKDLIVFDYKSNNFYYRSSPYNASSKKFVGKPQPNATSLNFVNLLFPTTVVDLGYKESFYDEIILDPKTKTYIIDYLDPTSYGDASDLVNLFAISRITDENILKQILKVAPLKQLFSRPADRVDGDFAQLLSINSEIGVVKFSPEFYESDGSPNSPVTIQGTAKNPVMVVFFSSTTEDLQMKDYLSPNREIYRNDDNTAFVVCEIGVKSQTVPFYKWELDNASGTIFGSERNNWATRTSDIFSNKYQSLDRINMNPPTYFQSLTAPSNTDTYRRGYIFSVDSNGNYSLLGQKFNKFLVGAPNHFYFGVIKGASALDKFKIKYSLNE